MTQLDIMVPAWGQPAFICEAVDSVLAQDQPHGWHLTVVHDDPEDEVVEAHLARLQDPRATYVRNPTNLGLAGNFQRCLDLATGDYVVMLGSDDRLGPGYAAWVTRMITLAPRAAILQPGVRVIDDTGAYVSPLGDRVKQRLRLEGLHQGEQLAASLCWGNWLYFPSLCFKREALQGHAFRRDLPVALDLALVLALVAEGHSVFVDSHACFEYRRHAASVSSIEAARGARFAEERSFYSQQAQLFDNRGWSAAARAARLRPTSRLNATLSRLAAMQR